MSNDFDKLHKVQLLVLDFDGVMTDDRVFVADDGKEMVVCSRQDGLGIENLKKAGLPIFIISKEKNSVVAERCKKLGLDYIQGCDDKLTALKRIVKEKQLTASITAYIGNDINDIDCLKWVGIPIAVANARPEVSSLCVYITDRCGGDGAIREVADKILQAKAI